MPPSFSLALFSRTKGKLSTGSRRSILIKMIKPGDKVRVVKNRANGKHPVEDRLLHVGDTIIAASINDNKIMYSCVHSPTGINYMFVTDVVKEFMFIISRNKP